MSSSVSYAPYLTRHSSSGAPIRYQRYLLAALDKHLTSGQIEFLIHAESFKVGNPRNTSIKVRVHEAEFFRNVACYGGLGMGESYMAGDFEVEGGRLDELLTVFLQDDLDRKLCRKAGSVLRFLSVRASDLLMGKRRKSARCHAVGDDFLTDVLDDDIDTKPENNGDEICRKLGLQSGQRFLDIGCGDGGLVIHAARHYGVTAVGITRSRGHFERAQANVAAHDLQDKINVVWGDLAKVTGRYDRVASVDMLESISPRRYAKYYRAIRRLLTPNGWALAHMMGLTAAEDRNDAFIEKYIYPGPELPRLSVMTRQIESNRMTVVDVENLCGYCTVTTKRRLDAFRHCRGRLDPERYDETFKSMWEYYLCADVAAALAGDLSIYQVLFTSSDQRHCGLE